MTISARKRLRGCERGRVEAVGNTVNNLAFRWLWSRGADHDAFDGLIACCWRAKRNLYAVAESNEGVVEATRSFITRRLNAYLRKCSKFGRRKVLEMALAGKFRYVARQIRNQLRDHVRETYRQKRSAQEPEPSIPPGPTEYDMRRVAEVIQSRQKQIVAALGDRRHRALVAAVNVWPVGRTRRERKGRITQAIAGARNVSLQQARADRKSLILAIADSSDPLVITFRTSGWFRWLFGETSGNWTRFRLEENPANRETNEKTRGQNMVERPAA
jgi:hypothetical protein